jgi:hypothetical protein
MEKIFSMSLWPWARILAEAQPASASFLSHVRSLMAQPPAHSVDTVNRSDRQVRTREANPTR